MEKSFALGFIDLPLARRIGVRRLLRGKEWRSPNRQANVWPMGKCIGSASSTHHWHGGTEIAAPWGATKACPIGSLSLSQTDDIHHFPEIVPHGDRLSQTLRRALPVHA